MRVLQVASEVFPLVKTGGLADVMGALPQALLRQGHDVRLLLPGLPAIADALQHSQAVCQFGPLFGAARVTLRRGQLPHSPMATYVVDAPFLYRRDGSPYQSADGREWPDNLQRFALLGWVAAQLAAGELDGHWTPEVLHAHDWHAAMSCAYIAGHPPTTTTTVFTVHNLAFQGLFPPADFHLLGLSSRLMTPQGLEFHGRVSFMKAGLAFADRVTTVSPTYALEIATPEFGSGLEGVIRGRGRDVSGILNGVDGHVWNPATDAGLPARYSAADLAGKPACKQVLQRQLGLEVRSDMLVLGVVSRLTAQKGLDLLLQLLPWLVQRPVQLAVLGSGDPELEAAFGAAAAAYPNQVAVRIGYDETFAHGLIAGSDAMLVPSRFEPCGLTQLYALRYGTVPIVRRVGGLADTVVDASEDAVAAGTATGFDFVEATPAALQRAIERALHLFSLPETWRELVQRGMAQDFSWEGSARAYSALYQAAREQGSHRSPRRPST